MWNSKIVGTLAVVAVLSTVGVGYAVTSSSVYLFGSASAGSVSLAWVESGTGAPSTYTTGNPSDCVATFYATEVTIEATDMVLPASGNGLCDIYDPVGGTGGNSLNITNTGSFSLSLSDSVSCTPTCSEVPFGGGPYMAWETASDCWEYIDANTWGAAPLPVTLSPGAAYPGSATAGVGNNGWFADLILEPSAGCAGSSFSVTVTFTATG